MAASFFKISKLEWSKWETYDYNRRNILASEQPDQVQPITTEQLIINKKVDNFFKYIRLTAPEKLSSRPYPNPFNYAAPDPTIKELFKKLGNDDDSESIAGSVSTECQTEFTVDRKSLPSSQSSYETLDPLEEFFSNFKKGVRFFQHRWCTGSRVIRELCNWFPSISGFTAVHFLMIIYCCTNFHVVRPGFF